MQSPSYTPPLGSGDTADYDAAIRRWTRERRWRSAMLRLLAPSLGETIVDIGCGTGSFALLVKAQQGEAQVIGLDPDAQALAIAAGKADRAGLAIDFRQGFADGLAPGSADAIVSSLVLHQVPLAEKGKLLVAMHRALRPGGRLLIADYLRQKGMMRLLFRATVQKLDGIADTQPNADGAIPGFIREAGFTGLEAPWSIATLTGRIGILTAKKAG
jgi:ubiquinone/menaquinone biosynthesis C-methylase UbiE